MTLHELGQIIKDLIPILSAIGVSITFISGIMMLWGGLKQKDKYRDEALKKFDRRISILESGDHCAAMKCECEEDRAREIFTIVERIDRVEQAANHNYDKLEQTTRYNFEKVFNKLDELAQFKGAVEEFKNGGALRPPGG